MGFFDFFKGGSAAPAPAAPGTADTDALQADYTITSDAPKSQRLTTSVMTQEQLRIRRMNMIEASKFGRPAHENIMLKLLRFWLLIGPIAFVALTTAEVAYILTALVPESDAHGQWVIWGGALFIDLAMMFTTFGVAVKRSELAEKREAGTATKRDESAVAFGTLMWLVFAVINIISQGAFLYDVISHGENPEQQMWLLWVFVGARVVGFILGDASTAFFLASVEGNNLKLLARAEREKGTIYADIARAEGERQLIEAKAEADMRLMQIEVQQKEQEAQFMAQLKRQMFEDILTRRPLPPAANTPELNEPNKSRIRRLDTSSS